MIFFYTQRYFKTLLGRVLFHSLFILLLKLSSDRAVRRCEAAVNVLQTLLKWIWVETNMHLGMETLEWVGVAWRALNLIHVLNINASEKPARESVKTFRFSDCLKCACFHDNFFVAIFRFGFCQSTCPAVRFLPPSQRLVCPKRDWHNRPPAARPPMTQSGMRCVSDT